MTDGDRKSLQQSLRETWMGALGVLSGAEAEVARTAHRWLGTVGLGVDGEPPATMKDAVHELVEAVKKNRSALEQRVDDGVKAAAARVGKPIQQELASLRGRLETLQQRVEALARKRGEK